MEESQTTAASKPLVPEWLVNRQLSEQFYRMGVLPPDLDVEDLVQIIEEENGYGGVYSPELLAMMNGVDGAFVTCLRGGNRIFYREVFEPWYFNVFAPRIFDCKLPVVVPKIVRNQGSGGGGALLVMLLVAVLAAGWFLFSTFVDLAPMWKMLRSLDSKKDKQQQSAETAKSPERKR